MCLQIVSGSMICLELAPGQFMTLNELRYSLLGFFGNERNTLICQGTKHNTN